MGTEREKDMKARRGGGMETREGSCYKAYGLCEETDVSVWKGEVSARTRPVAFAIAIPPRDEQTDVWRGCSGMLRLSELIQPFS